MKDLVIVSLCMFLSLVFVKQAYTYLDPGTGSMILQAGIAAIVGSAVVIKMFWRRIKSFCLRLTGKGNPKNPSHADDK